MFTEETRAKRKYYSNMFVIKCSGENCEGTIDPYFYDLTNYVYKIKTPREVKYFCCRKCFLDYEAKHPVKKIRILARKTKD